MADNTCMFGCFPEYEFKALPSLSRDRTEPDIQFFAQPYRFMSASLYIPSPLWKSNSPLEDGPASFPWERKDGLGGLSTMCRSMEGPGNHLNHCWFEKGTKARRGKKISPPAPPPFKKGQYIGSAGKISDSSVKLSIH